MLDLRLFFIRHTWWGKIIGAFLGYLIAGPVGAFLGIFIGNFFDKGLSEHFSRPHWPYHAEKRSAVQQLFLETLFLVMGYLAKSDGRVSEEEIHMVTTLMNDFELNKTQKKSARQWFNEGKKSTFDLERTLINLYQAAYDNPSLLNLFVDIQYNIAQVDGLCAKKQAVMGSILSHLGFAPLKQQYHFYETFNARRPYTRSESSSTNHTYRRYSGSTSIDHAYALLNITSSATKKEVKAAYRRLISQHHPDKLIAQGRPEKEIKLANEKTQQIRKAYEAIFTYKGWS